MNLSLQRPNRPSVLEGNPISLSQTGCRGEEGLSTWRTSARAMQEGTETEPAVPQERKNLSSSPFVSFHVLCRNTA